VQVGGLDEAEHTAHSLSDKEWDKNERKALQVAGAADRSRGDHGNTAVLVLVCAWWFELNSTTEAK
jgi:hypothetical protein